uniref:NACHT domain-containing protein n=1 Tax=Sparus aurata TaxID=8175 RepID=A0A671XTE1_SPAAU
MCMQALHFHFLVFAVDGAVAPVQMSSSPPGSLSDTASKAMSATCASPVSPSSALWYSVVLLFSEVVKDHIQEAKAHMSQTCQDMEAGLSLTSHYVDVQVSQRETFRSGKNTSKFLDKEMIIMGDTDRQKSFLRRGQIFEGPNGDKPKRYIVLLGNAGMGKTMLIRKLCLDWSRDCIPQFDFVFLLDGKALSLSEPTFSLQTLLLNISSFAPPCLDPEAVYAQILAAPKRVLIIFDGFDQLRDYETLLQTQEKDLITSLQRDSKAQTYTVRQLYSAILQRVLLPGCTLLLSTRPRGTATQLLRRADSFLEVCGFTPADIETYLSQYFTDPALRASALDNLKSCSYLHLFCWNPGVCRLVCMVLEQSKSSECLPQTLTGLCHQVLQLKIKEELLSQLSSLAWDGVKANSSVLVPGRTISAKLKGFGHRTGLFLSYDLRTRQVVSSGETKGAEKEGREEMGRGIKGDGARKETDLTQRFAVGLLFHKRTELQRLDSCTETAFRDMVSNKQALVTKHLEGLSHGDLSPAQVLESCHYVYEASSTHVAHLATNLPEVLTFHGVPLNPSDVFAVQNILKIGGTEGRSFCLDLEDSGIQISGLRALVGLNNINTYRACIADVITLWEQLQQSSEEELQQGAVSKFKIHPLKATQVCHIEHLAKLVNIHMHKRLSNSQFDSILAEGVPAVTDLHKLEFDVCSLLLLSSLSQNCIGDQGVKKLATTLRDLPKLHCLSLYSNEISDVGAESLAAVLPHMTSLTDLDVKYNKLTDVGAQSLGVSLRNCKRMKTLRLWNQCIPYGVFERLQQQDSRILWH